MLRRRSRSAYRSRQYHSSSRFISFITSEACEKCKNEKRKTINGEDLLYAINTLGFESYVDILKLYLNKYRDVMNLIYLLGC
jgi:nuclear transcription Y subunit beta